MRTLLHLGLFALTLAVVGQAGAQDRRRGQRNTTVVIAPQVSPRVVRPAPPTIQRRPPVYVTRQSRVRPPRTGSLVAARLDLEKQRRDHEEIVRLTRRWKRAASFRDPRAQRHAERSIDAWIGREIAESSRWSDDGRYGYRLQTIRRDLRAWHGAHGRGHRGRGHAVHKGRILDELVVLSERQVSRAYARSHGLHLAFAVR